MPTQADVTAMETKTTKMTFIIIPLFLCRCGEVALMSIQTFVKLLTTYTFCSDNTSEDNKWNLRIIVTVLLGFV